MRTIRVEDLPQLFAGAAEIFAEKKDELCEMDAQMGDGDLGLTMSKGYGALPDILKENLQPGDLAKTLMKAGMKMASAVPSTMGTLMASGIMEGGKALKGKGEMGPEELVAFLSSFAEGIKKRGKCQIGDRTILDAMDAAAKAAQKALDDAKAAGITADLSSLFDAAVRGAEQGVEATKQMLPKFGKAAVFSAKAIGRADQGAVAGKYLLEGLRKAVTGE